MEFDSILLYGIVPAVIVLIIMCLLSCLRCGKHDRIVQSPLSRAPDNIYTVPTNYSTVSPSSNGINRQPISNHRRISSVGDRFMVPIELLPPHFDYTAPGVQYKGDHVVVKDLKLIETPKSPEYQTQSPYNPNFVQTAY